MLNDAEFRTARTPHGFSRPVTQGKPALNDRAAYNKSLAQSLGSKLFFVRHIPMSKVGLVVDFGCADGSLLKALRHVVAPGATLIGIDKDPAQCIAARSNFPEASLYLTDIKWANPEISNAHVTRDRFYTERKTLLVLSSVLHEVLTDDHDIMNFWRGIEQLGFDYVAIRDMAVPHSYEWTPTPLEMLRAMWNNETLAPRLSQFLNPVGYAASYELRHAIHFLLKYPYEANWERELSENYLPYCVEEIEHYATSSGAYEIAHSERTMTKHFKERVRRDLGIDVEGLTTHLELVLKRKD